MKDIAARLKLVDLGISNDLRLVIEAKIAEHLNDIVNTTIDPSNPKLMNTISKAQGYVSALTEIKNLIEDKEG